MNRTGKAFVKYGLVAIGSRLFGTHLTAIRPAGAEELRIGFIAPMTGPFAQVGKDMVNGFEMYMNEVKGDFGGATVKFILEDNQAKPPTAVLKAEKLIGARTRFTWSLAVFWRRPAMHWRPSSTRDKVVYIPPIAAADDLTQRDNAKYPYLVRTGWTSFPSPAIRSGSGLADRDIRKSR